MLVNCKVFNACQLQGVLMLVLHKKKMNQHQTDLHHIKVDGLEITSYPYSG